MLKPERIPLREVPESRFEKVGFGLSPVGDKLWQPRLDGVEYVLSLIDGDVKPVVSPAALDHLRIVRDMFKCQHATDRFDWFTVARMTGFPAPQLAKQISADLSKVRATLANGDKVRMNEGLESLRSGFVGDMLDGYVDICKRGIYPAPETGFAYILFSTSAPEELMIGATEKSMDELFQEINRANRGLDPYGIAAAYLVNDPASVQQGIAKAFADEYSVDNVYVVNLGEARDKVETILTRSNEIVLSPWHAEGPERVAELNIEPTVAITMSVAA